MVTHSKLSAARRALHTGVSVLAAAVMMAGCTSGVPTDTGIQLTSTGATANNTKYREATGQAQIEGFAKGPQGIAGSNLVSNNGSNIIAGNSSRLISPGTSRYGTLALTETPVANAIVYLTDPEEHFFAQGGEPVTAFTDAAGTYKFASKLPTDQVIIVNVMLADNRREVGFTVAKAGKNTINVSVATTYVTEFLRDRAFGENKKMADFDLTSLQDLTRRTELALAAGDLAVPELAVGKINEMNQAYALAVGLNKQGLGDAWAKMLGKRVLAVTSFAGSGESGYGGDGKAAVNAQLYKPKGMARDKAGNFYIADEGNHMVRKVAPDGTISTFSGDLNPSFKGDGGPAKQAGLWWPRTVAVGPDDNLYIADTLNMRIRRVNLQDNAIQTIVGSPDQVQGAFLNDFGGDDGPALDAKLAGVRGMAFDSEGSLIFSDSWDNADGSWHHIRKVKTDGTIVSIVGVDGQHGFNGDGKPGRETLINYVNQVAVDAQNNIYFADARNHRVRKYDAALGIVRTVAGNGTDKGDGDGKQATEASLNSPYGVAVDSKTGRVYISERGSRKIRMVEKSGIIRTIVGGGTFSGDGEAAAVALVEPHDLYLDPDGNLLIADSRAAKIRKLWLQFGM
jgi:sugar lactone lactonase YvrE